MSQLTLSDLDLEYTLVNRILGTVILQSTGENPITIEVAQSLVPESIQVGSKVRLPLGNVKSSAERATFAGQTIFIEFEARGKLNFEPLAGWSGQLSGTVDCQDWEEGFTEEVVFSTGVGKLTYNLTFLPNATLDTLDVNYTSLDVECTIVDGLITTVSHATQYKAAAVIQRITVSDSGPVQILFNTVEELYQKLKDLERFGDFNFTKRDIYIKPPAFVRAADTLEDRWECQIVIGVVDSEEPTTIGTVSTGAMDILPTYYIGSKAGANEIVFNQRMRSGPVGTLLNSFAHRVISGVMEKADDVIVTRVKRDALTTQIVEVMRHNATKDPMLRDWMARCPAVALVSNYLNAPTLLTTHRELEALGVESSFHCVHNGYMDNLMAVSVANTLKGNGGDVVCTRALPGIDYYPPYSFAFQLEDC